MFLVRGSRCQNVSQSETNLSKALNFHLSFLRLILVCHRSFKHTLSLSALVCILLFSTDGAYITSSCSQIIRFSNLLLPVTHLSSNPVLVGLDSDLNSLNLHSEALYHNLKI